MSEFDLKRIEKPNLGFALHIPASWREERPMLGNSPYEVARFYYRGATSRGITVFRDTRDARKGGTPQSWLQETQAVLEVSGCTHFSVSDCVVAERPGARLDFDMQQSSTEQPLWTVREYFVIAEGVGYCFALGANTASEDAALLDAAAGGLEIFEPRVESSLPDSVFVNWYPRPRQALALARQLAASRGEPLGVQHILMGLVEIGEGVAFDLLNSLGVTAERLRLQFERRPASRLVADDSQGGLTPAAYRLLAMTAPYDAATLGHSYIGTEHLLMGLVTADRDEDEAWELLAGAGTDRQSVRNALADELERVIESTVRGVGAR